MAGSGKQVAKKCMAAFNMKVIIYDPYISDNVVPPGVVRYSNEEDVYKLADVRFNTCTASLRKPGIMLVKSSFH